MRRQKVIFLPKPQHQHEIPTALGLRPIVLLSHVYKWWATARLEQFRMALAPHSSILGGRAKVQVQRSVAELALQLDHAELTTDEVGGIHADISKAFEGLAHVQIGHVMRKAGLPDKTIQLMLNMYAGTKYLVHMATASVVQKPVVR
eukprot:5461585-Amphidinium_carterae.1